MKNKLTSLFRNVTETVIRYPLVLLMALVMTVGVIFLVETDYKSNDYPWQKLVLVSALGISLQFGLRMLVQSLGKWKWIEFLGLLFLTVLYFYLPKDKEWFTEVYAYQFIVLYILSHLLVSFVPFTKKIEESPSFWEYNKNLFVNFALSSLFSIVLIVGINLAILAIENLFNIHYSFEIYADNVLIIAIFGGTLIFLLFNESGLDFLKKGSSYPVVLKFFTQFVLIPLLAIYLVILYLYSIKILINWELPRGWVSYLILAYSVVGIFALLLVHPLIKGEAKSWVKVYSNWFFYTLIPLLVLLFVAIFTRVLEYGFTEPRYFVLALAIWLTTIVVYFIYSKKQNIQFIPISLFAFGLFGLVFPFLNAFSVSKRSQKNRLMNQLAQLELLKDGELNFDKTIGSKDLTELINKMNYLGERKESKFIEQVLPEEFREDLTKEDGPPSYYFIRNFVKVKDSEDSGNNYYSFRITLNNNSPQIKLDNYQYAVRTNWYSTEKIQIEDDLFEILEHLNEEQLTLKLNNTDRLDFMPMLKELAKPYKRDGTYNLEKINLDGEIGNYEVRLSPEYVEITNTNKENRYTIGNYTLYFRKKS